MGQNIWTANKKKLKGREVNKDPWVKHARIQADSWLNSKLASCIYSTLQQIVNTYNIPVLLILGGAGVGEGAWGED